MIERQSLTQLPARELIERLASGAPVPGGGSASALAGSLGAALVEMVVRLSLGRPDLADHEAALNEIGVEASRLRAVLLELAERDADAYDAVVKARRLPKTTGPERTERARRVAAATAVATRAPLEIAEAGVGVLDLAERVAPIGNPNVSSDLGVAGHLAAAAVRGALLNVRINLPALAADDPLRQEADGRAQVLLDHTARIEGRLA